MNSIGRKDDDKNPKNLIFTRETLGVVLVLFSTFCFICLLTGGALFSFVGDAISSFLFGIVGYFAYVLSIYGIVKGVMLTIGKKINLSKKTKIILSVTLLLIGFLVHILTMRSYADASYGDYLVASYNLGAGGLVTCSGGGIILALFAYWLSYILTNVGAYVVLGVLIAVCAYVLIRAGLKKELVSNKSGKTKSFRGAYVNAKSTQDNNLDIKVEGEKEYPISDVQFYDQKSEKSQSLFVMNSEDFLLKSRRELKNEKKTETIKLGHESGLNVGNTSMSYAQSFVNDMDAKINFIKQPAKLDFKLDEKYTTPEPLKNTATPITPIVSETTVSQPIEFTATKAEPVTPVVEEKTEEEITKLRAEEFSNNYATIEDFDKVEETIIAESNELDNLDVVEDAFEIQEEISFNNTEINEEPQIEPEKPFIERRKVRDIFEEDKKEVVSATPIPPVTPIIISRRERIKQIEEVVEEKPIEVEKPKEIPPINREYFRPPLDLLETYSPPANAPRENHEERMEIIKNTLEEFRINTEPQGFIQGPAITRYEIKMPAGVSVKNVTKYDADLKMRLAERDGVRILAPIPGKNLVGVEVSNKLRCTVGLKSVLEGAGQQKNNGGLIYAIGQDIVGKSVLFDLAEGPHYLVAGSTGSGKSVCLNVMIVSLIMRYTTEELRFILIDPKRVEFKKYEHLPHLLSDEIITEPNRAICALNWACDEMNRRNKLFEDSGVNNIASYNENIASATVPKMARIVIIIDEFAQLVSACRKELEAKVMSITSMARSSGIHLVLATQRPSVDVVTGVIKANLPSRIALRVTSHTDSMTIMDEQGAEKLLGKGDMLYRDNSMSNFERYQGAFISDREVKNVVNYIIEKNKAYYDESFTEYLDKAEQPAEQPVSSSEGGDELTAESVENDDLFLRSLSLGVLAGTISISQLQRRFQIGFARAGRIVDTMERLGYIGGNEGNSRGRKVLITREQYEEKYGDLREQ